MRDLSNETLKLNYPCSWSYKVVVHETINIKTTICEVIEKREHSVKSSNVSKKGKFKSYTLELLVHNEDDRKELYKILGEHNDIKMVL